MHADDVVSTHESTMTQLYARVQIETFRLLLKAAEAEGRARAWNSNHRDGVLTPSQQDRHLLQQRRGVVTA